METYIRSNIKQTRINYLAIISRENATTRRINYKDKSNDFDAKKAKRLKKFFKNFKKICIKLKQIKDF